MNELKGILDHENNKTFTENGAVGLKSSGKKLVDLNFRIPSKHSNVNDDAVETFHASLEDDFTRTIKWMFFLRDVREGLGERDSFISFFKDLAKNTPETAVRLLPLIPEFGRWSDVVTIFSETEGDVKDAAFVLIKTQLMTDCKNVVDDKPVSLLGKWMPSINASKKSRKTAFELLKRLVMLPVDYRKMLVKLRKHIDVVENHTCSNDWNGIDYNRIPSNANLKYFNAFMKHDPERRQKYLDDLSSGKEGVKMNAGVLYPYEIYNAYSAKIPMYTKLTIAEEDPAIEQMWKNLKRESDCGGTMVVVDGSGSMTTKIGGNVMAIDVSRSLGVYFSETCSGEYKDKVIEFSANPRYIDLSGCKSLREKVNTLTQYDDCSSTNMEKVFDLVLKTAVDNNLKQEELPERILVISDMEFDCALTVSRYRDNYASYMDTLFETIGKKWKNAGYMMPKLVFWNVNSRTGVIPVSENEFGVALVSGFSTNNVKLVLSGKLDPWEILNEILDSERYSVIDKVLA